jgi:hypothetical protein
VSYEAWRISFQSSEQAAKEAFELNQRLIHFTRSLLDPESLGLVANAEIRDRAREVLGMPMVERALWK